MAGLFLWHGRRPEARLCRITLRALLNPMVAYYCSKLISRAGHSRDLFCGARIAAWV
jgi:hypothetical protein